MTPNAYKKRMNRYDDVLTARRWWSWLYMHVFWKTDDNAIAREVLEMIPDNFQGKLLDVPVGTAVFTANKYRRMYNAAITGLDYSPEMLDIAKCRMAEMGLNNVCVMQADVANLPFADDEFDCVLSMNGFHAFADKSKAFAETFRVLKPGGTFCGCFYITGQRLPADWFVRAVLNKKGFFRSPHYTLEQVQQLLGSMYGADAMVKNYRSIVVFKCIKPVLTTNK